jgi:hypothetical protein
MMLVAALAALVLATSLAACGGGDGSSSTAAEADGQGQAESKPSGGASQAGDAKNGTKEGKSGGSTGGEGQSGSSGDDSSNFVPKHHKDSGGGSRQYRVKGGDNSVQEFGGEADTSELDAAAAALHNFLDARAEGNWDAACNYMSKSAIESFEKLAAQQIEATSCGMLLEKLTNPAAKESIKAEAAQADVGSLRIEGERAFIIYTDTGGTIFAMPMANEDGTWKVASLAGTPLN